MKKIIFIASLCSILPGKSQNLVPNYSFENMTTYTDWYNSGVVATSLDHYNFENGQWATPHSPDTNTLSAIKQIEKYWSYIDEWDVPHRKHVWCGLSTGDPIGSPDLFNVNLNPIVSGPDPLPRPFSGDNWAYTGFGDGEYLVVETEDPLEAGKIYFIETFCSSVSSSDEGTILLFKTYPEQCGVENGSIEDQNSDVQTIQEIVYPGYNPVFYLNQDGQENTSWTRFRTYFSPTVDMTYLVIGSGTSLMWDDIRIVKVDEMMCRENWYFDNTVFNYPFEIFQAGDFIKAGTGVDPEAGQLDGPVTVLAGSHTRFTAGNSIELLPGFTVEYGAIFETDTVPCQQLCAPFILPDLTLDCVSGSTSIGVADFSGTYTDLDWSPALYLDNPDSINPTFTPPAGQSGSITYTVTYTNSCPLGAFPFPGNFTFNVTVNYIDPALVPVAPSVNYSSLVYDDQELTVQITVNDATSQIEVVAYDANGELSFVKDYDKGIDFTGNTLNLSFGNDHQIFWSNCMDYHFVINAKNLCGDQTTTVEFDWLKTWDSGSSITASLPNVVTAQDGDGINDYYCFDHFGADYYELKIYYENAGEQGPKVYEETGIITDQPTFCTNFDGHADNGNLLNEDAYLAQLSLFNYCGAELLLPNDLFHLVLPDGKMAEQDTTSSPIPVHKVEEPEIEIVLATQEQTLILSSNVEAENQIIITNALGSLVFTGSFKNNFSHQLASGIYYVSVKRGTEILIKQKIVIV